MGVFFSHVIDASDENLLKLTRMIAGEINGSESVDEAALRRLLKTYDVAEINIIDENHKYWPDNIFRAKTRIVQFLSHGMLSHGTYLLTHSFTANSRDRCFSSKRQIYGSGGVIMPPDQVKPNNVKNTFE